MFRIQGHLLRENGSIGIELTKVYGIGRSTAEEILSDLNIPVEKKVKDLTDKEQKALTDVVKEMKVENDLRREVNWNIKRLKEIRCYRWMRHNVWLPVRGQRTLRHAKTAKKLLGRSRVRPVLKKKAGA